MKQLSRYLAALLLSLSTSLAMAQTLSLTFDDGLNPDKTPQAAQWNQQLLEGLGQAGIKAMVFPSLARTGGDAGLALVRNWGLQGHAVGNHTASHRSLADPALSLQDFIADVEQADASLRTMPQWTPMLRFPYLKEGDTLEKRDGLRRWMQSAGYRAAPVSIDASDWYYNQVYAAWLAQGRPEQAQRVKAAYIRHMLDRAAYYDGLARQVLGRSPAHVMLLHTNGLNAAALPELIAAFAARGWRFVSPSEAFQDPLYTEPANTLPAGESVVWAHAQLQQRPGLRYPAEDDVYERPLLQAQGLLPDSLKP
ncbi:MAG: polysaccharide deacetylase family protein [Acidovorax sp.]|jgi:peptidoglycan/xylan/chitin deacetylase (PgdA/CDA1 family)|nr:polysaccharide deacetylase family protein [Acidovorax sp.]